MSIVEVATFRLAAHVTNESFLALDRRVQRELVPNQPGFLRRTTAHDDHDWLVVTLWATDDAASAFHRAVEGHPLQAEFMGAVGPDTFRLARYTTLD